MPVWRGSLAHQRSVAPSGVVGPRLWGIAALPNGDLVVSESGGYLVLRVSPSGETTMLATWRPPVQARLPAGLCVEDELHVLVADSGNRRVLRLRVDGSGAAREIGAGVLKDPKGVAVHSGECLSPTVLRTPLLCSRSTAIAICGRLAATAVAPASSTAPTASPRLQPANWWWLTLRMIACRWCVRMGLFCSCWSAECAFPVGLWSMVDGRDNLVVADTGNRRVLVVSLADRRVLATLKDENIFAHVTNVALLVDGSVAVTDWLNQRVMIV